MKETIATMSVVVLLTPKPDINMRYMRKIVFTRKEFTLHLRRIR